MIAGFVARTLVVTGLAMKENFGAALGGVLVLIVRVWIEVQIWQHQVLR